MLEAQNITKTFRDVVACNQISFKVEDEIVVLLGPSGCGKTTTLRCIAGLEVPDSGKVILQGEDISDLPPQERGISMVFQDIALFPHLTIRENIRFGLDRQGIAREQANQQVREIAEKLHIEDLLDRKPSMLSGGQCQRAAIGRALVTQPAVFLLDEPFANLDAKLKIELRSELKKLQRDFGTPLIHVTHDQEEAMILGDKIIVMKEGQIRQKGGPTEIYNNPNCLFTATFIGAPEINLFETDVFEKRDTITLHHDLFSLSLDKNLVSDFDIPKSVIMGIRPQHVSLANPKTSESGIVRGGKIRLVEPRGVDDIVVVDVGGVEVRAITEDATQFDRDSVALNFDKNKIVLFNEDGKNILR